MAYAATRTVPGTADTPTTSDDGGLIQYTSASAKTITLTNSSWVAGRAAFAARISGGGTATFVAGSGVTVNGDTSIASGQTVVCQYTAANTWEIVGTDVVPVASGGTGATTAAAARANIGLGDIFRPVDYGADPTGVTESSAEIQSCIDACQAANGVLDLRGRWLVDTGLVINTALDSIWVVGGPVNRGGTPHSADWACALIADTGFTGTLLTVEDVRGFKMSGVGIDMGDADSSAIAMLIQGTYWTHIEDVQIDGSQAIGISVRGGTAGNYWGTWERVHVNGDSSVGATSRAGTGFFIDRNDANSTWVNQHKFLECSANFLNIGWDIVEPGAGMLWENCQAESGNTSTGIGVRATEPFEITYLDMIWRGGEINNYATGVSGRVMCEQALNLSPTARANGAMEIYYDGRASNSQNRRMITFSEDSYAEVIQRSSGTYGEPIAGQIAQETTVPTGSVATTVLTLPADETGRLHSGLVFLSVQALTSVWLNTRRVYHLSTYWDSNGSGVLTLVNADDETAVTSLSVTFTHTGGVWALQVSHNVSGESCRVRAHYVGLLPGV